MANHCIKLGLLCWLIFFTICKVNAQTSKLVAECTITYTVDIQGSDKQEETTKRLYIKGRKTRTEISNPTFYQAIIFDNKTGESIVLKEVGGDKYISFLNAGQWREKNKRWDSSIVLITNETKKILNYNCRRAVIKMKDESSYVIYFTTDLTASATENLYQFRGISGLILEYDSQTEKGKSIEFKAKDINFNPVPAAKFITPSTGYRIL